MKKKKITAAELQGLKCKAEIKINSILHKFNGICVENDFQIEDIKLTTENTDALRAFDVDILIV